MNPLTQKEAKQLFLGIVKISEGIKKTQIVACPPFIYLESLRKLSKKIPLGAQNTFFPEIGAFTGEVSGTMLADIGVKYVILGHSERRAMGEDNTLINKKIKASLSAGLLPILCVGERERDEDHEYLGFVNTEVKECLQGIAKNLLPKIMIAYEPIWAISTTANRRDATPADSLEMVIFIRKILSDISTIQIAKNMRFLYGGSVNDKDAGDFLKNGGVDGLLIGRASLDAKKFSKIISVAEQI